MIAPSRSGGAESVVTALATAVRSSWVVALNQVAEPHAPAHPFVERLRRRGVAADEIRCGRRRYRAEVRMLERKLREVSAWLVHSHGYHGNWVSYFAARRAGLPVVTTVHGYLSRNLKERVFNELDRRLLRRFDAVIAVSQGIYDQLVRSGVSPGRVNLVQNGLPAGAPISDRAQARGALGLLPQDLVIGWVGRLSPEKGPDLFLRALAGNDVPGRAVIVGDGPEDARLKSLARVLKLDARGRVTFAGFRPDAAELLPAFDVLALTSRIEGTPMVVLEAVAAGVPIVAFETGGIPDLLNKDTAWLVPAGDIARFGGALRTALSSPPDSRRRAEMARAALADRLNLSRWVEQVRAVYEQALRRC